MSKTIDQLEKNIYDLETSVATLQKKYDLSTKLSDLQSSIIDRVLNSLTGKKPIMFNKETGLISLKQEAISTTSDLTVKDVLNFGGSGYNADFKKNGSTFLQYKTGTGKIETDKAIKTTNSIEADSATITNTMQSGGLSVGSDTDILGSIGRAKVGGISNVAVIGHYDNATVENGIASQNESGDVHINAKTNRTLSLGLNGVAKLIINAYGLGFGGTAVDDAANTGFQVPKQANVGAGNLYGEFGSAVAGTGSMRIYGFTQSNINNSNAKQIAAQGGPSFVLVVGRSATKQFFDILQCTYTSTKAPAVLHSYDASGTPVARTYTNPAHGTLTLQMADDAETYDTDTFWLQVDPITI